MNKKVGFIGCGNMARAIIGGMVSSGFLKPEYIFASNIHKEKAAALSDAYGLVALDSNIDIAKECDVIVLSVKPHIYRNVLDEIKGYIKDNALIVTIAAGVTLSYVKGFFNKPVKVIRTMPNTPAMVGEGMTAITYAEPVDKDDVELVKAMFSSFGLVEEISEEYIDAFSSLCGSSPAFVDMFIEAMTDAAVLMGLPREKSYIMAAQAVKGSAKMVIETGKHPGVLKDMVCSPKGTTIEGVRTLEEKGMRSAVFEAVLASAEKAKELSGRYK